MHAPLSRTERVLLARITKARKPVRHAGPLAPHDPARRLLKRGLITRTLVVHRPKNERPWTERFLSLAVSP